MSGQVREAVLGELLRDGGEYDQSVGWFILGVDGYFDVDNALWCEFRDDDAPWTSEHFELHGSVSALAARVASAAADREARIRDAKGNALREAAEAFSTEAVGFQSEGWGSNDEDRARIALLRQARDWLSDRARALLDAAPAGGAE